MDDHHSETTGNRRKSRNPTHIRITPVIEPSPTDSREGSPGSFSTGDSPISGPESEQQEEESRVVQQQGGNLEVVAAGRGIQGPAAAEGCRRGLAKEPDREARPPSFTQFDIKATYSDEALNIIPTMPVEVESPSVASDDDESSPKRLKLSESEDQEMQTGVARGTSKGSVGEGMEEMGSEHRDNSIRKSGSGSSRSGEGKSAPRTVILPSQREVLERLWQLGMRSTSRKLRHLQEEAQRETGLRMDIIHNWIHNRRRKKNQEELVTRAVGESRPVEISTDHSDDSDQGSHTMHSEQQPPPNLLPTASLSPSPQQLMVVGHMHGTEGHLSPMAITSGPTIFPRLPTPLSVTVLPHSMPPVVTIQTRDRPAPSIVQRQSPLHLHGQHPVVFPAEAPRLPIQMQSRLRQAHSVAIQTDPLQPEEEVTLVPFVAKVRCSRRDVTFGDFIEVDVPVRTFPTLMHTLCQELNMSRKSVARVRKLPDVWVRKDSDVRRMSDYVELEVVLKDDALDQHHFQHRKL